MRRPLQDLGGARVNTPGGAPVSTFAVTDPSVQANKAPVGPTLLDFSGLASSIAAAGQRRQDFEGEEFERIGKEAAAIHEKHPDWTNEQVIAEVSKSTNSPHSVIRKLNKMFEDGDVDHPRFRMGLEGRRAQYALRSHLNAYTGENRAEWARRYAAAGPGKQGDVHREILAEIQESVNTEIGDQGYWGNSAISEALFEADMKILDMVEKDGRALMQYEDGLLIGKKFNDIATDANTNLFDIEEGSNEITVDDKASIRINGEIARVHMELFGSGTEAPQRKFDEHIKGMAREIERVNGGEAAAVFLEDAYENVTNGAKVKILQASGTTLDVLALADKYRNDAVVEADTKSISRVRQESDVVSRLGTSGLQKRFREAAKNGPAAVLALREQIEMEVSQGTNEIVAGLPDEDKQFVNTYLARAEADAIREANTRRTIQGDSEYEMILEAAAADTDLARWLLTEGSTSLTADQRDNIEDRIADIDSRDVNLAWQGMDQDGLFTSIKPLIFEHLAKSSTDIPSVRLRETFEREALQVASDEISKRAFSGMNREDLAKMGTEIRDVLKEKYAPVYADTLVNSSEAMRLEELSSGSSPADIRDSLKALDDTMASKATDQYKGEPAHYIGGYSRSALDDIWEDKLPYFDTRVDPVTRLHHLTGEKMGPPAPVGKDRYETIQHTRDKKRFRLIHENLLAIKEHEGFKQPEVDRLLTESLARTGRISLSTVIEGMRDPARGAQALNKEIPSVEIFGGEPTAEFFAEVGEIKWDKFDPMGSRFWEYRESEKFLGPRPTTGKHRPLSTQFPTEMRADLEVYLKANGISPSDTVMSFFIESQIENWK